MHYIFHYLDFLRDFCSLSESISWVDYMRIALVFFQNIECATYALETQYKLNTKYQVPNAKCQMPSAKYQLTEVKFFGWEWKVLKEVTDYCLQRGRCG